MNLIYYRGLNCYLACVMSIADALGVRYRDAFATLWSETDFIDDLQYHHYASGRIFPNLEALGLKRTILPCATAEAAKAGLDSMPEGSLFPVGMDSGHIPWSPLYNSFGEPHYFFARKENADTLACFDPTYNITHAQRSCSEIIPYIFELNRIDKCTVTPPLCSILPEAREILRKHPETHEKWLAEIQDCKPRSPKNTPLIKQINAMLNNRYLFQHFWCQYPHTKHRSDFFDTDFFKQWEAIKNGLYKASILKDNKSVIHAVCALFSDVMRKETDMAAILASEAAAVD